MNDRLTDTLHRHADRVGDAHPVTLDDVRARARSIRRRRYAAAGVAAVAVLAVVVPTAVSSTGVLDRGQGPVTQPATPGSTASSTASGTARPSTGPSRTPSPDATQTPTATPTARTVPLTTNIEQGSGAPQIPYLFDGHLNLEDGSTIPVAHAYDSVARLGTGWVVTGDAGGGHRYTAFLDASGHETKRLPGPGVLAVSPDGSLVSYVTGTQLRVAWDGAWTLMPSEGRGTMTPVAVAGTGRCDNPDGVGGCMVYYDLDGTQGAASYASSRHGIVDDAGYMRFADESVDYLSAGMVASGQSGSCWAVRNPRGRELWHTCTYQLGRFSPDGKYLLAYPAGSDGLGPRSVTILDARTGRPLVTYAARGTANVFVNSAVWDVDGTVLATVWDTDHWSLMRMTADGVLSSVSKGGLANGRNPDRVPLHFAARP